MTSVTVLPGHVVDYGKDTYKPGESFDCDDKEAKRLTGCGVVESSESATDAKQPATVRQLVEAIGKLDKENKDHWVKSSGAPNTKALESVLQDLTVSAADRDRAWKIYQENSK